MKIYTNSSEMAKQIRLLFPELEILIDKLNKYDKENRLGLLEKIIPTIAFRTLDNSNEIILLFNDIIKDFIRFKREILKKRLEEDLR